MAVLNLDLSQAKFSETPETLPPGWYPAVMIESDIVPTAAKTGFRLATMFQITDGPGKGRKVPAGFNIDNPSAQAVEISMNELKTMSVCMGHFAPLTDSTELHNRPLQIRLVKQKDSDYNEIKGYKTIDGKDAKDAGQSLAPMGHQAIPAQGFAAPTSAPPPPYAPPAAALDPTASWQRSPDGAWKLNPTTNAWEPNAAPVAPPPAPAAVAPPAAPSWAPPSAPAAPAASAPPAYAPPAAAPAAAAPPSWAPQAGAGPTAPSWAPPAR